MLNKVMNENGLFNLKSLNAWFEELTLPVAPACNMMCNFCSKDSDCVCNGNDPHCLSKSMTPRQAVSWALSAVNKNSRTKVIKISGPGEPLCNHQTFEVLRRLNNELPDSILCVSTNGLLLKEKVQELVKHHVSMVEVSMNAVYNITGEKLFSRMMVGESSIISAPGLTTQLLKAQIDGIAACLEQGIKVTVNTIYFPSINEKDIFDIARLCRDMGVKSMRIISAYPNGKLSGIRVPSMNEMAAIQHEVAKIVRDVEIRAIGQ